MSDQLFCVDERCNLSQKLISKWIDFIQHQELEHKMLTIQQFKAYLIQKKINNGPQFSDQRKNQFFSQAQESLNVFFDQIETRIQQFVKQELQEIFDLCLKDIEIQIDDCIQNDIIDLNNFETYFQFEEYQSKCLNFYNNNIQIQIQEIINQFCRQKDTQFEDIFKSLTKSFIHQKNMFIQIEESKITTFQPQIQQQKKENIEEYQSLKGYQQIEKLQQNYFQSKEYTQESKPEPLLSIGGQKQNDQINQDYFQFKEYTQESYLESSNSLKGHKQIEKLQQDYFQNRDYTQESNTESLLPLKGYKQVDQKQQEYFQYKEYTQAEPYKQVQKKQQDYSQNKEYIQESKSDPKITKNQTIIQDPQQQNNNQRPKKKLNVNQKQNTGNQIQQTQNQISQNQKEVKIPQFKQINGKVEYFTPQLMNGVVQLLDNFKTAKSQSGFILFDGFFTRSSTIKLELLILEIDKQSEIEIGLVDWSIFKLPRETGKPQKGVYSLNNKGSVFKDVKQKNKDKIFKNQTKLKLNIMNNQQQFIGEKTIGFDISQLKGNLSLFAFLQNGQIQIVS
ncbi:unnamed protein product [Paramecium primaurelia]|uniref:Uncharacterized protein n=1 Tax=Paramecium primaurelia TaxID=5886 RepID=A0A8S1N940_PARPR|nr:unnamed protein product [Paramecium primaurelia]